VSAAASVVWAAAAAAAGAARTPTEAWLRPARVAGLPPGLYGSKPTAQALLAGGFRRPESECPAGMWGQNARRNEPLTGSGEVSARAA
jgi:hypothetical protein